MDIKEILQASIRQTFKNKLVWGFGFLTFVLWAIPALASRYRSEEPIWGLIFGVLYLVAFALLLIIGAGLIYLASETSAGNQVRFSEAWAVGKSRFFRVVGLLGLLIPVVMVSILIYRGIANLGIGKILPSYLILFSEELLNTFAFLGMCAIVINDLKSIKALWTSILVATNNLPSIIILTFVNILIHLTILMIVMGLWLINPFRPELPFPFSFSLQTLQYLIVVPFIIMARWLFYAFILPWKSVVFTIAYKNFTQKIQYPTLVREDQQAA